MQDAKYLYVKKRPLSDLILSFTVSNCMSFIVSVDQHGILLSMTLVRIVNVLVYKPPNQQNVSAQWILPYLYIDTLLLPIHILNILNILHIYTLF